MLDISLLVIFVLLWWLIVYHHLVYPLLLRKLARVAPQKKTSPSVAPLPTITIVVPAYNEAWVIKDKIRNLGMLDYPADKLDIIIACDGCTDSTADRAVRAANEPENRHLNVRLWDYPDNVGKTEHLNRVLPLVCSNITALSDASALISRDGLLIAAQHFNDPEVGVVAASYQLAAPGSAGEHSYWQYQQAVKLGESQLGAPIGVHGALYFYRTTRYRQLEADIINDDFVLPMRIVAAGSRAIYEPDIIALELEPSPPAVDMQRRSRIAAGNLQQLLRLPALLHPRQGGIAFAFASGKGLRAVMPFILFLQLLITTVLALSGSPLFSVLFGAECVLIGLSLAGFYGWGEHLPRIICVPCYLICGYIAAFKGGLRYLFGLERGRWHRVTNISR